MADLLKPFPAEVMDARKVSTTVNNVRNKGPECIAGITEEPRAEGVPQREVLKSSRHKKGQEGPGLF